MRKITVKCDNCGFEKTFDESEFEPSVLKGWAYVNIQGPYTDMEICPECAKSFFDVKEIKEKVKSRYFMQMISL